MMVLRSLLSFLLLLASAGLVVVEGSLIGAKEVLSGKSLTSENHSHRRLEQPVSEPLLANHFNDMPGFYHGVASGDPLPHAIILWTRYTPSMVEESIDLEVRIAAINEDGTLDDSLLDPSQNKDLRFETITVDSSTDFTAKIDVTGLEPGTRYVYAFAYNNDISPVGQTKTAPESNVTKLTYAILSCAVYTNGYFHAYDVVSTVQDLDFWAFVGDYIYEYSALALYASDSKEREEELMPQWETVSLQDYRLRYALYHHGDEGLRNLRRRAPMIAVWDDHEVADNGYGMGEKSNSGANNHQETCEADLDDPAFLQIAAMCSFDEGSIVDRMEAAARAYLEWMPLRHAPGEMGVVKDQGSLTKVIEWGDMATIVTFDSRISDRSEEPTLSSVFEEFLPFAEANTNVTAYTDPDSPVKTELDSLAESVKDKMRDPQFTMVGADKVTLLEESFQESKDAGKPWQIYASSTLMGPNIILNPNTLWEFAPESVQDDVKATMDELLAKDKVGALFRMLTAMAVTSTPWNRDDWNGFWDQRTQILNILQNNTNNPIVIGGDLHDSWGWQLYEGGEGGPEHGVPVAVNIGAPGVTAPGIAEDLVAGIEPIDEFLEGVDGAYLILQEAWKSDDINPGLIHAQIRNRGFVIATATKEKHVAEFYHISAENLVSDYPTARANNANGLTSEYFCSGKLTTYVDQPGSFEKEEKCDEAVFETEKRPSEWTLPTPTNTASTETSRAFTLPSISLALSLLTTLYSVSS